MKNIFSFLGLCLLASNLYAEVPKAGLLLHSSTINQWPAQYQLNFNVPADHHAYLNKGDEGGYIPITFDSDGKLAAAGLAIESLSKPEGVYEDAVKAQVLRDQGDFRLSLKNTNPTLSAKTTALTVRYQLCNDLTHVCFRPQTVSIDLPLPMVSEPEPSLSVMDKLLNLFKDNQHNTATLFVLMLLSGLLSVATPCVYPMLPITSMFIVGRAGGVKEKEKHHALAYVIGIICTYMLLGLVAGMTGGAFNVIMQSAWVNLAFALFFAFFAVALLGFYELAFMQNEVHHLEQNSAQVKGVTGTWLMGAVAGLVISPCVGPIVFALLLNVADNIAHRADELATLQQSLSFFDKLTIAAQGSIMMGGFGLGVGLPFFIFSVVKIKLPRAGYWMNKVKYAFGVMILYFAYVYYAKGMGVLGVDASTTLALAIGLLMIWLAVIHCNVFTALPADASPNHKMHHYCGVIALLIGAWLLIANLNKLPFMATAQAKSLVVASADCAKTENTASADIEKDAGIDWYRNFAAAQKVAQQTGKPIFIDFYASWCANCIAFKAEAANNVALNQALRDKAIAVKLVDKEAEFEKFREDPVHRQLKIGLPYFAILKPDGQLLWSTTDYTATQKMIAVLMTGAV